MLNFNTQAGFRNRLSSHGQVFRAYPLPNELKTRLKVVVAALLLCCFSFQTASAQCNIATPSGTDVDLYLGANGITTLNSNVFIPYVSSPNCPGGTIEIWFDVNATIPFPPTNYDCTNEGLVVPVFVTIEGPFGQSNSVLFTVNIVDNAPPLVAWPANVTVPADPSACAAVVNSLTPVVTDNCPGSYTLTWTRSATTPGSGSNSANGLYNVGTTTVTFTLVDSHGTPNQVHNTTVIVNDSQAPTINPSSLPNQVLSANGSCQASTTWNGGNHPIASDNCALMFPPGLTYTIKMTGATTLPAQSPAGVALPFTFNKGVTTVTYTAFDGVNTTTVSFTVTVNDTTPPSFGAAPTVSSVSAVNCSAPVNINLTSFITDNCTTAGSIVKTFTVTSASSGSSPYPLNVPQNGAHVNATFLAGVYTIVFKATDGSGNIQTLNFTLSVIENTPPVANCMNITANLGANGSVTVNAQDLDNGSTDNCGVTVYEMSFNGGSTWVTSRSFNCGQIGNHAVLFRVKDAAGNISVAPYCAATITIADVMPPVAQCKNISVDLNAGVPITMRTVLASEVNNMSYDNCTSMAGLTLEISEAFAGPYGPSVVFDCSDVTTGINPPELVYLRVLDSATPQNISNICTAQVTVNDVTPPVAMCQNTAVVLNANGHASITPAMVNNGSSDNCSLSLSVSPNTFNCNNLFITNTVTLTASDMDGNTATCTANVSVSDNTAPTLNCPTSVVDVYLDAFGNVNVPASALGTAITDNCSVAEIQIKKANNAPNPNNGFGSFASSLNYDCDDVAVGASGTLHSFRIWARDASNNPNAAPTNATSIFCYQKLRINDNIAPVAICNSVSVALGSNGQVTIPATSVSLGSTDNCFSLFFPSCGLDREISKDNGVTWAPTATFNCTNLANNGQNTIKVRITDCHTNSAICTTTVTIQDNEDPVVTAPADVTIECDQSLDPSVNFTLGVATATDNCSATAFNPPYTDVVTPGLCAQAKTITRTWKFVDQSGNTGTDVQIITVEDTTIPTFTAPADVVLDCPGSYTVANQFCNNFAASAGLPLAISPLSSGVYLASLNINVPSNGKIMDIDVTNLKIEHTWVGDLQVELISPIGTPITIGNFTSCGNVDDININLDDEALNALNCGQLNLGQTFQPTSALSGFDGQFVNGTWTLRITDNSSFDGGALVSWGLNVCYVTQPQDLSLSGDVTNEADNCDTPQATFVDYHAYKDFIAHSEGGAYNFAPWTGSITNGGSISATSTSVTMVSDNNGLPPGAVTYTYDLVIPANGFIVFDWDYNTADSGGPFYDPFGYAINGLINFVPLVETGLGDPISQNGRAIIPVSAGDVFALVQNSNDGHNGAATTVVSNFLYTDQGMPVPIDGCERKFCVARFWKLSDDCGNTAADQVQVVETRDITAPVVNYPNTKNVLAQNGVCNPMVDLNLSSFISDACSNYDDLIITNDALANYGKGNGTFDASGFYSPGTYTITFTVTDECGNVNNHTITLTVTDSQNPTAICQNATVQLDNSGVAIVTPASINNGSYDNCSITSMVVTPNTFTIADIGANNVTLTVTDPSGNTNSCSAVVTVLGGVMFDAGDAAGATGTTVLVPVTVTNFNDIISFDLDIDISAGTVATVNAVEGINPALAGMLFPITGPTHIDVSWIGGPVTLPAGTVAFNVRVNLVGTSGSSTPIIVNVVEVGTPGGVTPSLGLSGTISIVDPNTLVSISGTLMQHANSGNGAVHLADVDYFGSVSGTINNAAGAFSFNVPSGSNITIEPNKDINWNNGVSTLDALCTHYYSIGLPLPGACTGPVTPYQKIAADANANDAVTAFDAALIQQIAINNTPVVGNTSWRFVPTTPALPSDPFALGFDETRSYTNVTSNITDANFYGIKTGDVTAPFANGVTGFSGGDTGDRANNLTLQVSDAAVTEGQDVAVAFKSNGFAGIYSMQTTFNFDPSVLEFVGASGNALASIIFNTSMTAEGKLAVSWYNLDAVTMENGENLFTLQFKAKGNGVLSELLSSTSEMVMQEVATSSGDVIGVDLVFESYTATGEQVVGHFALHQNRPNPFSTRTAIGFNLPTADHASLTITDAAGKTLKVLEGNFTAGYHQFMVERKDLPATGVFFYQLKTADFQAVKKMILVD
ncbi:MAG: T9SS type A sorting domain-containing protein [Bacteroidetes bacterium]|nr:T9SS type A sorting domain-containing protein [Bacteroidota bacterium]